MLKAEMKTRIQIRAEFEIILPQVPDFIELASGQKIDIADVETETLGVFAEAWTDFLHHRAGERRKNRPST